MNRYRIILAIFLIGLFSSGLLAQVVEKEKPAKEVSEADREAVTSQPLIEIKKLETGQSLYSIELRVADIKDFLRVIAHDYNLNIMVDEEVKGKVTASLRNISLEEALERIADMHDLKLEKKENVIIVKPNLITRVFILKHIEAEELFKSNEGKEKSEGAIIYDLLSPDGKLLLGKQLNSIVVIDYPANVKKIEEFIEVVDQKMAMLRLKLQYLSVKQLFSELTETERKEREKQREERKEERAEIKEMKQEQEAGN